MIAKLLFADFYFKIKIITCTYFDFKIKISKRQNI